MSKLRAYIIATVTMVLGAGMGVVGTYYLFDLGAQKYIAAIEAGKISSTLASLRIFRSGDTNSAVQFLESQLDGALIGLAGLYHDVPAKKRDAMVQKALTHARDYRAKYPHNIADADVGTAVTNALNLATNLSAK